MAKKLSKKDRQELYIRRTLKVKFNFAMLSRDKIRRRSKFGELISNTERQRFLSNHPVFQLNILETMKIFCVISNTYHIISYC